MASMKYWIWLSSQTALRPTEKAAVLKAYGDPETAFFAPKGDLARVEGLRESAAEALEARDLADANRILGACDAQNIRVISLQDTLYPRRLKQIYAPPPCDLCQGQAAGSGRGGRHRRRRYPRGDALRDLGGAGAGGRHCPLRRRGTLRPRSGDRRGGGQGGSGGRRPLHRCARHLPDRKSVV